MKVASLGYRDLAVELVGFPIHLYENLLSYDFTPVYFFLLACISLPYFLCVISCFLLIVENCTQCIKTLISGCKSIAVFPN